MEHRAKSYLKPIFQMVLECTVDEYSTVDRQLNWNTRFWSKRIIQNQLITIRLLASLYTEYTIIYCIIGI